ncbi:MAG: PEP-CTERM sorting domain-containing protein, partial [Vicinamibacterales bacterium]
NPESFGNLLVVDGESAFAANTEVSGVNGFFLLTDERGFSIFCTDTRGCFPPDLGIFAEDFAAGTVFRVTSVNGESVAEPATLTLLGLGLAAAAVRRRRLTSGK